MAKKIKDARKRMAEIDGSVPTEEIVREKKMVCNELDKLLGMEETMWRQQSRVDNLKEGDRNTKYFHMKATGRKRWNMLRGVRKDNGEWACEHDEITAVAMDYFTNLFSTMSPQAIEEALEGMDGRVTEEMNEMLVKPYDHEEVKVAIFQMGPSKTPGPDWMNANFFQKHWHIIGQEVALYVIDVINGVREMADMNETHIDLIPKMKNPLSMSDFRPISLCNVIYKIISKMIANRMNLILPEIISHNQSAFTPGSLIMDNTLVAFETFHYMQSARSGKRGCMAVKLDMSKAYDRVEWVFLEKVMEKMGFDARWTNVTMRCVSSVSHAVVINGEPSARFVPGRGL